MLLSDVSDVILPRSSVQYVPRVTSFSSTAIVTVFEEEPKAKPLLLDGRGSISVGDWADETRDTTCDRRDTTLKSVWRVDMWKIWPKITQVQSDLRCLKERLKLIGNQIFLA